tara:strand:- start:1092 stop:2000 length:909 start_codon:yes stop_codon:yes gene_type:complete
MARGTFQGLLAYQMEVDEKREKLKEKIAERKFELQKLMIKVGATGGGKGGGSKSRAKMDEYYKSMAIIQDRLIGEDGKLIEGANQFLGELALSPAVAPDILAYIEQMDEESRDAFMGGRTSPEAILDLGTILKLRDEQVVGQYVSAGDMATMLEDSNLSDDDAYLASQARLLSSGTRTIPGLSVFIPKARESFPALTPERARGQVDALTTNIASRLDNENSTRFTMAVEKGGLNSGINLLETLGKPELLQESLNALSDNPSMAGINMNPLITPFISTVTPNVTTTPTMTQTGPNTFSLINKP